ncbi:hypothetical protein [Aurantiacibacter luteus]|uniref:Uncharacterized protein n=1 Tax=Aurantiacibacter luteus TaxID=1581420 RepID=A0A0G9MNZ9_9SPHN|nr:hypothetical protein [Aurantiacibacter luteus]KLE32446.1 hypothetical protein AAW00_13530 [Aurantiacibacter luteus]
MLLPIYLVAAAFVPASLPAADAAQSATTYHYCWAMAGNRSFYSDVFADSRNTYHVAFENSWNSFLRANVSNLSGLRTGCKGPYDTRREAVDELNEDRAGDRDGGYEPVLTNWGYRG